MGLLRWLRAPRLYGAISPPERHRFELIIATARGFLAAAALLAVYLDPTEPTRYAGFAYALLLAYDLHSILVLLLLLRIGPTHGPWLGGVLHGIDLTWAVAITFLTEGPNSPFFPLFTFVLLAAAYRWGFRETLLTSAIAALMFMLEALIVGLTSDGGRLELNRIIMRCTYFLLAGFLLAFLSDEEKGLRAAAMAVNRLIGKVNVRAGLRACVQAVTGELLTMLGARAAFAVLEERSTGRLLLWEMVPDRSGEGPFVRVADLDPAQRNVYLFPMSPKINVWDVVRRRNGRLDRRRLDSDKRVRPSVLQVPPELASRRWQVLLGIGISLGEEWTGRLFIVDPTAQPSGAHRLRFLEDVIQHVLPVLHNVYLLRRLRSRVGAIERGRVARELHDSVVQSLIGLEMQIDIARRATRAPASQVDRLTGIQEGLRSEILNVRDLMQQLRPQPSDSKELVERLADLVDRFRRDTGIEARFFSNLDGASLSPQVCRELTRIVQEALVNVRKHSEASNVLVRLGAEDGQWRLLIEDDGRGLGSDASGPDDGSRSGPRVIRERIEAIGGTLLTTSGQGGLRLEMSGPEKRHDD